MNTQTINESIAMLNQVSNALETEYLENEGECTESTEEKEGQIEAIKTLLANDGIDSLGRWLKAKEDEKKSLKAEKDYISRKMESIDNTIDYIKGEIYQVMMATGMEKVKGSCGYSFTPAISETTAVDKELLKALYLERIQEAMTERHIPCYVGVTLTASATKAKEYGVVEGDEELFSTTRKPTCKFVKPRANKE